MGNGLMMTVRVQDDDELRTEVKRMVMEALKGEARDQSQKAFFAEMSRKVESYVNNRGEKQLVEAMRNALSGATYGSDHALREMVRNIIKKTITDEARTMIAGDSSKALIEVVRSIVREELKRIVGGETT